VVCALVLLAALVGAAPPALADSKASAQAASLPPAALNAADLREYQIAFRALDAGRWDVALNHAGRPAEQLPAKAVRWLYLQSGNTDAGFEEISAFLADNPHWPRQDRLELRAEQALTGSEPDALLLAWFRDNPPRTGNGFMLYAEALQRAGLSAQLQAEAIRVWREVDMSASEERAFRSRFRTLVPMEDEIYRLDRLIWDRQLTAAERQARRVPADYRALAEARIRLARRSGGVDAAIARVPPTLQDDPGLIYERMHWRRRAGRENDALELLAWPDMQSTRPDMWWRERAILSRNLLEDGKAAEAYRIASQHRVPDGAGFAQAEWFAGWVALRFLNDPERAFPHFRDMYNNVGYPVSRSRAAYWAGRAAEAAGKAEIAQQWYEVASRHTASFYGQMAAMKLPPGLQPAPPGPIAVTPVQRQAFEQSELARLVVMLDQIGADDTVRTLVRHMAQTYHDPGLLTLTAQLATRIGRLDLAVYTGREAIKSDVIVAEGWPELPLTASKIGDLSVVHGLIRQESGFDIDAVSRAGALGLMQLMPATAQAVSGWERIQYRRDALTADPDYNVRLGSAYLADLLEEFDGMLPMALAGYNAGPHRVRNWVRRFGDPRQMDLEDMIDWMESIPFYETRNYVQRVMENVMVYRQRGAGRSIPIVFRTGTG
jgi:soluble lytic murein transglycosylase